MSEGKFSVSNLRVKLKQKETRLKPSQGFATQTLISILKTCKNEAALGELQELTIHFKSALLKYMRFLLDKKLVIYRKQGSYTIYKTTKKGEKLMELLSYNDKPLGKQRI